MTELGFLKLVKIPQLEERIGVLEAEVERLDALRRECWTLTDCGICEYQGEREGGGRESGPGERTGTAYVTPERTRAAADPAANGRGRSYPCSCSDLMHDHDWRSPGERAAADPVALARHPDGSLCIGNGCRSFDHQFPATRKERDG